MLAPIVVFVYKRPFHTQRVLDALAANPESKDAELYVFCDGPKAGASEADLASIDRVKAIAESESRFNQVHLVFAKENKGLANSICDGITEVLKKHDRCIVVEDDILVSNTFLYYMNQALSRYENEPKVMQISGFSFDIGTKDSKKSYFLPFSSTWGWATWKRVWDTIDFGAKGWDQLKTNDTLKAKFNLNNSYNYLDMMVRQMELKVINSWGIRFYWNVFKNKGLVLYPETSMALNIGFDASGEHCGELEIGQLPTLPKDVKVQHFPELLQVDDRHYLSVQKVLKKDRKSSILQAIKSKLRFFFKRK